MLETFCRPLSKSQKRRLQRGRQAQKKKALVDALLNKEEPSGNGCLVVEAKPSSMNVQIDRTLGNVVRKEVTETQGISSMRPTPKRAWLEKEIYLEKESFAVTSKSKEVEPGRVKNNWPIGLVAAEKAIHDRGKQVAETEVERKGYED